MCENFGLGTELFSHHGVLINHTVSYNKKDADSLRTLGTLSLVEYEDHDKFLEWRQAEVSVESEVQDQEWAVVQKVRGRTRTTSESTSSSKLPLIKLNLSDLCNFCVSKNSQQLKLILKDGSSTVFYFQNGNADSFVTSLRGIIKTSSCTKKDGQMYLVLNEPEISNLNRSFAELELFQDESTDYLWKFVKNLRQSPYETALQAFTNVTDTLLYKQQYDEVAELYKSISVDDNIDASNRVTSDEYEVIPNGPPLPPRTTPPRCPPLSLDQWKNLFTPEGQVLEELLVKEIIFHGGVHPSIRLDVWKYLLNYYPWNLTHVERAAVVKRKTDEYYTMKLQWKSMTDAQIDRFNDFKERKSLIEKDVNRTDRTMPFFAGDNNPNLETLHDVLMTYVMYNFDLGYVQGMSDLLSPILVLMNNEVDSFWCFVGFMDIVFHNFDLDQAGMKEQLQQLHTLVTTVAPDLGTHLDIHESNNMFFCFRWLLVWFKREFIYQDIMLLWEVCWSQSLCPNFHLLICVAILDNEKDFLISNNYGFTEILKHVNELAYKMDVHQILSKAEAIYIQLSTAVQIPNTVRQVIGLEVIPEVNTSGEMVEHEEVDEKDERGSGEQTEVQNHRTSPSVNFNSQAEEINFERSLYLQYT